LKNNKKGFYLLILTGLIVIIALLLAKPILQDEAYHTFSDESTILGIPNFWNVLSNLPFILVTIYGFLKVIRWVDQKWMYQILLLGIALVGLGSGYYHWGPTSTTLIWDRLPMTITFMSLFSIIISEFVSKKWGTNLFIPFIILGLSTILYWIYSPSGDLRPYVLVQFYPMIAIPIILIFFKKNNQMTSGYWLLIGAYVIAKLCEHFDTNIHQYLVVMSGHSLKHIFAAIGLYLFLKSQYEWKRILKKTN